MCVYLTYTCRFACMDFSMNVYVCTYRRMLRTMQIHIMNDLTYTVKSSYLSCITVLRFFFPSGSFLSPKLYKLFFLSRFLFLIFIFIFPVISMFILSFSVGVLFFNVYHCHASLIAQC